MLVIFNKMLIFPVIGLLLSSISSGILGTYISAKNARFVVGSMSHSVIGGIGAAQWISYYFNTPDLVYIFSILSVIVSSIVLLNFHNDKNEDNAASLIWILGMSIGMIFASKTPGGSSGLLDLIIGNIFWISKSDVLEMIVINIITILFYIFAKSQLNIICIDEPFAKSIGIRTSLIYLVLIMLTGISCISIIQSSGTLVAMALFTISPSISSIFTSNINSQIVFSILVSALCSLIGLFISINTSSSISGYIALTIGILYCVSAYKKEN